MILWPLAGACLLAALLVRLRRTYSIIRVDGDSMAPALVDGDRVLARRVPASRLRRDQIAVVADRSPRGAGLVIKRIAALPGDRVPEIAKDVIADERVPEGRLVLLGDNASTSYDSRALGFFPLSDVHAVAVRKATAAPREKERDENHRNPRGSRPELGDPRRQGLRRRLPL
ncbi:S26 family signal peptidase [Nonomuraea mesophila]|uniref:S26 family signal peptidase n=1 Tax=Nonomuraea mesophila TaxID=2530382 RepID=A0A4R5E7X5_9ACTN|nr:S26 family signal peptidase [Nonomuraea mesophila]TDE27159.1 S26 family signal peptidase [Nonomuraea mesophila]